jgi:hypothetical protein
MRRTKTMVLVAAGTMALAARAQAQDITVTSRTQPDAAKVTFGYLCDDRFVIKNDGTQPVNLEYGLHDGNQLTAITVQPSESVELSSRSNAAVELWKDGTRIATAAKEPRSCANLNVENLNGAYPSGGGGVTVAQPVVVTTATGPTYVYSAYPYYWDPLWTPWAPTVGVGFGFVRPGPVFVPRPLIVGRFFGRRR